MTVAGFRKVRDLRDESTGTLSLVLNFVCFEYLTGMRGNEAHHVALDRDIVTIEGAKYIQVRFAKGKVKGEVDRLIPVTPPIEDCLTFVQKRNPYTKPVALLYGICLAHAREVWKTARTILGIPATMHGARAGFANQAFDQGVSVQQIQWMLGHSNEKQTMKYIRPSVVQKAKGFGGIKV
jgi:integrase